MRECTKCGIEKEDTEFYWQVRDVRRKPTCKKCFLAQKKGYDQTEAGKAAHAKYDKSTKGRATKAVYRKTDKHKEAVAKYKESDEHKTFVVEYEKSDERKANRAKYWKSEKGKASRARSNSKRRAKIEGALNDLTLEQWKQIQKDQKHGCAGCGVSFDEQPACKDHIIPVHDGGDLTAENIQALCKSCNSTKGSRPMSYLVETLEKKKQLVER